MRRRLARFVVFTVVLPVGVRTAEHLAYRLEVGQGPTIPSRLLRRGSSLGRAVGKYGRL